MVPSVTLADTGGGQTENVAVQPFIALQKNDALLARRTVAQKPPLRFFSKPGTTGALTKKIPVILPAPVAPDSVASPSAMSREQAQLILSIFDEAR